MLAGMFKAPTRYAPHVNLAASRARANEVLSNMVEAGFMSEGQVYGARMNPAKIVERGDSNSARLFPRLGLRGGAAADATARKTTLSSPAPPSMSACRRRPSKRWSRPSHAIGTRPPFRRKAPWSSMEHGRRGARHGRRQGLRRKPVQPRHPRLPPARLLVQALRLSHRARERHYTPNSIGQRRRRCRCGHWAPKNYSGGYRGRMTLPSMRLPSRSTPSP